MTAIPDISDFTASTVTEAQFKTALTTLRTFLVERLGTDALIVPQMTMSGNIVMDKEQPQIWLRPFSGASTIADLVIAHPGNPALTRMLFRMNFTDNSLLMRTYAADGATVTGSVHMRADKVLELNTGAAGVGNGQVNVPYATGGNNAVNIAYLTAWAASASVLSAQTANSANALAANVVDGADLKFLMTAADVYADTNTIIGGKTAHWYNANMTEGLYLLQSMPAFATEVYHYSSASNRITTFTEPAFIPMPSNSRLGINGGNPRTINLIRVI